MPWRRQTYFLLLVLLEEQHRRGGDTIKTMSAVDAAQTTSTRSCEHEKDALGLKVCAHRRSSAGPLDPMPCSLPCHLASQSLPGCPTLIPTWEGDQPRTLAHLNAVVPGALRGGRTLRSGGGGGPSATAAALE